MDFNEFIEQVRVSIADYLEEYRVEKVKTERICKNNGVEYTGLIIVLKEENIAPNIYLDYYYFLYKQGYTLDCILEMIKEEYKNSRSKIKKEELSVDFKDLENRVFLKLVNYEQNMQSLEECPYIQFLNLAVTFRYLVKMDQHGIASASISNRDIEKWNIDKNQLFEMAKANTRRLFPPCIRRMDEIVRDINQDYEKLPKDRLLYVLTNAQGINGAACLVYEDILRDFAREHKSDFYVLPSSIHEVILFVDSGETKKEELTDMVQEINKYAVPKIDFLSDNVYFYHLEGEFLTI